MGYVHRPRIERGQPMAGDGLLRPRRDAGRLAQGVTAEDCRYFNPLGFVIPDDVGSEAINKISAAIRKAAES